MNASTSPDIRTQMTGASFKIASCACFAAINGIVRYLTGGAGDDMASLPVYVIIFFQNLVGTLFMLPFIINNGRQALYTNRPFLHFVRVLSAVGGIGLWYWGVYYLPLATAVALSFTGPIFTVIGAHLFLKEAITTRRLLAIGVCFVGAFVVSRPDRILMGSELDTLGWPAFLPLGAAIAFAISKLLSRVLASQGESADSMTFYLLVLMAPLSLVPAGYDWVTPSLHHWPWLVAMGVLAAGAHYTLTKALSVAEVSFVMPFGYSKIILSAAIGYIAFGEVPKSLTIWIGSLIIFLSVAILSMPERKQSKLQTV
jgi:drug/metabolite transporter (DMT)-like permease